MWIRIFSLSLVLLWGCNVAVDPSTPGTPTPTEDVQPQVDGSNPADSGAPDTAAPDTAAPDATSPDATEEDQGQTSDATPPAQLPVFTIVTVPSEHAEAAQYFSKYVNVFGVHIFATDGVPDAKVMHAAHVMAQYLDNDEDGEVDNPSVLASMTSGPRGSALVMFATFNELESSGVFESNLPELYRAQDLYGDETHPQGSSMQTGFDATLEEVLHLVTSKGYSEVYPSAFGEYPGSNIGDAMDLARGGQFDAVPASYPAGAWYHYDDWTCDYPCQVTEYFYWALTSILGAQSYPGRCQDIAVEWEPCTKDLVQEMDPAIYSLLTNPEYKLPTVLPDGTYGSD